MVVTWKELLCGMQFGERRRLLCVKRSFDTTVTSGAGLCIVNKEIKIGYLLTKTYTLVLVVSFLSIAIK